MTETNQPPPPALSDPQVRRARQDAYFAQQHADLHGPEPLARFHAESALERIRAAGRDLLTGAWSPSAGQREVVRQVFEARRAEPPGTPAQMPEPGTWPPGALAASQAAHDAYVAEQLHAIFSTAEGRDADRCEHITAFTELMRYTGREFTGRNDERYQSLSDVVRPAVTAAVYLWSQVGWPDEINEDF